MFSLLVCEGVIEINIGYPHNDLNNGFVDLKSSWEECQSFCRADNQCVGWDYNKIDKSCWKKKLRTGRKSEECTVTGPRNYCPIGKLPFICQFMSPKQSQIEQESQLIFLLGNGL